MRIVFVYENRSQRQAPLTDAERLMNHLRRAGHAVQLLFPRAHDRLPLVVAASLRQRWRRQQPDVVHAVSLGRFGQAALRAARAEGIATSASLPGDAAALSLRARLRLHRCADQWVATTPLQARLFVGIDSVWPTFDGVAPSIPEAVCEQPIDIVMRSFEKQLRHLVADKALQKIDHVMLA